MVTGDGKLMDGTFALHQPTTVDLLFVSASCMGCHTSKWCHEVLQIVGLGEHCKRKGSNMHCKYNQHFRASANQLSLSVVQTGAFRCMWASQHSG